jgi:NRAMP (natural resistance-associated macrophage protein)-like metal ion transporter
MRIQEGRMTEVSKGALATAPPPKVQHPAAGILPRLGPGLITGAADDDPSGIATYSQVGAQFGLAMLWTMLFSLPLMAAIQEVCGRLGRITGAGIAANLRTHYPKPLTYALVALLCIANIFNVGADIAAMGASTQLVLGGSATLYAVVLGIFSLILQVYVPYHRYVHYLKWLTLSLFAYVATAFVVHVPWLKVLHATVVPSFSYNSDYWKALVAVLGTTISPYLFFWQTSQEAEEVRTHRKEHPLRKRPHEALLQFRRISLDTRIGMAFSNLVAFFIILTTAVTLHGSSEANKIQLAADAAKALQPLAGKLAFALFAMGIIGTGMLAVPVLTGSAAYAVAEIFHWRASLESKPRQAPKFYRVLAAATLIGIALNFVGIDPIRALYWSAVLNGIVSVPLMVMLMLMSANKAVIGDFALPPYLHIVGWLATAIMLAVSVGFLATQGRGTH